MVPQIVKLFVGVTLILACTFSLRGGPSGVSASLPLSRNQRFNRQSLSQLAYPESSNTAQDAFVAQYPWTNSEPEDDDEGRDLGDEETTAAFYLYPGLFSKQRLAGARAIVDRLRLLSDGRRVLANINNNRYPPTAGGSDAQESGSSELHVMKKKPMRSLGMGF